MLAALLKEREVLIVGDHRLGPQGELPRTLNHFAIELDVSKARLPAHNDQDSGSELMDDARISPT